MCDIMHVMHVEAARENSIRFRRKAEQNRMLSTSTDSYRLCVRVHGQEIYTVCGTMESDVKTSWVFYTPASVSFAAQRGGKWIIIISDDEKDGHIRKTVSDLDSAWAQLCNRHLRLEEARRTEDARCEDRQPRRASGCVWGRSASLFLSAVTIRLSSAPGFLLCCRICGNPPDRDASVRTPATEATNCDVPSVELRCKELWLDDRGKWPRVES
ncbi:hypothetical protein Q5P01_010789 [Channa striata]|uniref:Uncharacterized protein n=1 Tax=Channa striata TaxID=64152 RepID=A0AA88MVS0_CHASR|nr:hypothetical protein Q5P01_010789 [Channa striata]